MFKSLAAGLFGVPEHDKVIEDYKKELLRSINDDIEQSLHDELVKLGWTPPKKIGKVCNEQT